MTTRAETRSELDSSLEQQAEELKRFPSVKSVEVTSDKVIIETNHLSFEYRGKQPTFLSRSVPSRTIDIGAFTIKVPRRILGRDGYISTFDIITLREKSYNVDAFKLARSYRKFIHPHVVTIPAPSLSICTGSYDPLLQAALRDSNIVAYYNYFVEFTSHYETDSAYEEVAAQLYKATL